MRTLLFVLLFLLPAVAAADPVKSVEECVLLADAITVAHAAKRQGVPDVNIAHLLMESHVDFVPVKDRPRWSRYVSQVIKYVQRPEFKTLAPRALAEGFVQMCMRAQGQVDTLFGTDV